MSQSEAALAVRQLEIQRPLMEVEVPSVPLPVPSEAETRALDELFADKSAERLTYVDAVNFAAAAMLLHDVVKDTLAPPVNEDDDDLPRIKPKERTAE